MKTLPLIPSFRLDGRRALVTGGSRGLGFAAATVLASAGAHVTLAARSQEALEEAVRAIHGSGGTAEALFLDIQDFKAVESTLERTEAFDILINNAGVNRQGPMTNVTEHDFDYVMNANVKGAFFVAKAVAQKMVATETRGSIVNISSMMGHIAGPNRTVYVTSKHAIEGLTKAMAIEFAPHGIRVNSLCPALIETEMTAPILADSQKAEWFKGKIPLNRFGRLEDMLGPILLLASDASAFVTGASLMIDGGWTAQ